MEVVELRNSSETSSLTASPTVGDDDLLLTDLIDADEELVDHRSLGTLIDDSAASSLGN